MGKVVPKFDDAVKKVVTRVRCTAELNLRWLDDEDLVNELLKDMWSRILKLTFRHLTMNITSCSSNQYMSGEYV